ncbi:serine/threonine-protein kinase [Sandaracinus amylolyticus]|uniref:serine/threonine-protein kinase n=1 Tax=Sandaracinus amylolyticus TaxID=927083 RepID=UPI0012EE1539|nr:serine/threonine-protein kinase [Sandaracinus amylolyticus]
MLGDRYRIVRHLADGGMGKVYVGEQIRLGMSVAVKILDRAGYEDPMLAGRFEREAIATAALRCPHIVQVFDWGILPEGGCYLVMELLPGADLATLMMQDGLFGVERTLHVLRQLAIAIDHAHSHGIVHRDLKPENVMVDLEAGDFVTVLDFGVARDLRQSSTFSDYGEVVGTPEYMSPEQAMGLEDLVGPACDRWALAVIAMEMLTGDLPYPSAPATTTLRYIAESVPRRPSELGFSVPGLDAVFDRAMARKPRDRHGSARELVDDLERVLLAWVRANESHDADENATSGVRPRLHAAEIAATTPEARVLAAGSYAMSAAAIADMPCDEVSTARMTSAIVLAGLTLVGSAFAAGWMACMALAGGG